ncbi:hypothetical protein cyc_07782 [Cyclospora cayetanensis]|uniref:Transmembrane protein n=1 Tax=Cyclospora cayetanensis TaxID=88456 RepID=A0A1D3CXV1_9EIME|nr:hypothetical protein cyc_07782 [Cyclospora cayetanensis]
MLHRFPRTACGATTTMDYSYGGDSVDTFPPFWALDSEATTTASFSLNEPSLLPGEESAAQEANKAMMLDSKETAHGMPPFAPRLRRGVPWTVKGGLRILLGVLISVVILAYVMKHLPPRRAPVDKGPEGLPPVYPPIDIELSKKEALFELEKIKGVVDAARRLTEVVHTDEAYALLSTLEECTGVKRPDAREAPDVDPRTRLEKALDALHNLYEAAHREATIVVTEHKKLSHIQGLDAGPSAQVVSFIQDFSSPLLRPLIDHSQAMEKLDRDLSRRFAEAQARLPEAQLGFPELDARLLLATADELGAMQLLVKRRESLKENVSVDSTLATQCACSAVACWRDLVHALITTQVNELGSMLEHAKESLQAGKDLHMLEEAAEAHQRSVIDKISGLLNTARGRLKRFHEGKARWPDAGPLANVITTAMKEHEEARMLREPVVTAWRLAAELNMKEKLSPSVHKQILETVRESKSFFDKLKEDHRSLLRHMQLSASFIFPGITDPRRTSTKFLNDLLVTKLMERAKASQVAAERHSTQFNTAATAVRLLDTVTLAIGKIEEMNGGILQLMKKKQMAPMLLAETSMIYLLDVQVEEAMKLGMSAAAVQLDKDHEQFELFRMRKQLVALAAQVKSSRTLEETSFLACSIQRKAEEMDAFVRSHRRVHK